MKKLLLAILTIFLVSIVAVSAVGDLSLTVTGASGVPGDIVTVQAEVTNAKLTEEMEVDFDAVELLDVNLNSLGIVSFDSVTIPADSTEVVTFDITLSSTPSGDYTADIVATDANEPLNTDTQILTVTVDAVDEFTVSTNTVSLNGIAGDSVEDKIRIENTGSTTLSSWTLTLDNFQDDDSDVITMIVEGQTSLEPGEYFDLTVRSEIDSDVDVDSYQGTLNIVSGTASQDVTVNVEVEPEICEYGKQGNDLDVEIKEPDSGDDFLPGETIDIEVDVYNDGDSDEDFKVVAYLYNMDDGKVVESVSSDYIEIEENEEETFDLSIEIPVDDDWDDSDEYYLYVKAFEKGEEENNCNYERIKIDLERDNHMVIFDDITVLPANGLECGEDFDLSVEVINVGTDDEDDVYVRIIDSDFKLDEESSYFDLDDFEGSDNSHREQFSFTVPEDLSEGKYYIEVLVYFDDGDEYTSELVEIDLDVCSADIDVDPFLTINVDDFSADPETDVTVPVTITNDGDQATSLVLTVDNTGDFVTVSSLEYLSSLEPGQSTTAYVYLTVNDNAGPHEFTIRVADDFENEILEPVQITINDNSNVWEKLTGGFAGAGSSVWVIGDFVLLAIVGVLLVALLRKRN